jgi:hypothetical protein
MISTLKLDAMGCLHMWEGKVVPSGYMYTWKAAGKPADVYVQSEDDVFHIMENLTNKEANLLRMGYHITTKNIPSDYFIKE